MAFDGITISCLVQEMTEKILNGRIYKIAQPEKDELLLTIKNNSTQYRLIMSADASLPLLYFTDENKKSPMTAPNFCMLLRKHIQSGRIVGITQPGLERIVNLEIEHLNEMGDVCRKVLAIELMGKHSNIIFYDENQLIIDSMKHVSAMVSSVREVLPGRTYFIPETTEKENVLKESFTKDAFLNIIKQKNLPVHKSIYSNLTGFSPIVAQEICYRAGIDADKPVNSIDIEESKKLAEANDECITLIKQKKFSPRIFYNEKAEPIEYSVFPFAIYEDSSFIQVKCFDTVSEVLAAYYGEKCTLTRIRQKSVDLRRVIQTALERNVKKYDLQCRQLDDTKKRDKFKIYGELLHTYGYQIEAGAKSVEVDNYYTGEKLVIPLDTELTPMDNAKKYFDKYGKLKRTYEALLKLTEETKEEVEHLESVLLSLDMALLEEDLTEIKEELIESGYIRRKGGNKKTKITSKPYHYVSSDGFHIYVGKNNLQNEELTFKFAEGGDWWFHAKGIPGSHVIVKANGKELPDATFEEAGRLAAYFSKGREQDKVEIDYVEKKHVKKPAAAKPGFVVYYTNYSLMIDSDISMIEKVE